MVAPQKMPSLASRLSVGSDVPPALPACYPLMKRPGANEEKGLPTREDRQRERGRAR